MALEACTLRRFKPHLLMVLSQIGLTLLYFITEASFNHGMNPHVYITYRHTFAGFLMQPFAYFLERKSRPKLTLALFLEIVVLSFLGYPAPLSLTTWMNFVGAAQSAAFTAMVVHKRAAWGIGFNIDLWSTLYAGVVVCGLILFTQLWCTEEKGPVFVTMFNPLSTLLVAVLAYFVLVLVAVLAYFVLGEKLYTGSILGGVIVIVGLYLLLWGKEGEQKLQLNPKEQTDHMNFDQREDPNNADIFPSSPKVMKEEI